ncbi:MAG TPA: tRNA uridine-5-carboxymethylaminomethyl(34) synthesis GTPase MnmE [Woeseiaceae bacterium]
MSATEDTGDTIVARATPPGIGGIAVVRISGSRVRDIAVKMLGRLPPQRQAVLAGFRDPAGQMLDQGIAIYFAAPRSFTGEDVLELHGHGGAAVVAGLVDAAVRLGARLAQPGEFSRRAFLNGKLDLAQAEAIADLVASASTQAAKAALHSLSGAFSNAVGELQEKLDKLRMHVEAAIDFPEEEIDFLSDRALLARADDCAAAFLRLLEGANVGRVLRDGYRIVIIGRPNAGKSSLLNRLSGQESAIVTEVAGTTRDILREQINIDGLVVELVDTAGLRDDPDRIEAEGIRRAREALASADAVLWIRDSSLPQQSAGRNDSMPEDIPSDIPCIIVRNKIDLSGAAAGLEQRRPPIVALSAKTGAGFDVLRSQLRELAGYRDLGEGAFTARQRHLDALDRARAHFDAGRKALQHSRAGELFAEELRLSQQALSEITGEHSSDELLGRIFSEFCIGK